MRTKNLLNLKSWSPKQIIYVLAVILIIGVIGAVVIIKPEMTNLFAQKLPPPRITPQGWDYNITKRCIKSPSPSETNYFEDLAECLNDNRRWTIAVQSENTSGVSCPGPANQSFPINTTTSPVSIAWQPHSSSSGNNWSTNLTTNLSAKTHPCGSGYFTWVALMDHMAHGGGPFPTPNQLRFRATANFNDFTPNASSRSLVGVSGFITGLDGVNKQFGVEINLSLTSWGDADPAADIITSIHNDSLDFISMDGTAMGLGIAKGQDTPITINWYEIIPNLADRGYIPQPQTDWATNSSVTSVYIGHELNNHSANNAGINNMWITDVKAEKFEVWYPSDTTTKKLLK